MLKVSVSLPIVDVSILYNFEIFLFLLLYQTSCACILSNKKSKVIYFLAKAKLLEANIEQKQKKYN